MNHVQGPVVPADTYYRIVPYLPPKEDIAVSTHLSLPGDDAPVIDESRMMNEFGGSPEILAELRDLFLEHAPPLYVGIKQAIKECDIKAIIDQTHSLKGACATYGAVRLTVVCKEVEMAARRNDLNAVHEYVPYLAEEYEAVLEAVGRLSVG